MMLQSVSVMRTITSCGMLPSSGMRTSGEGRAAVLLQLMVNMHSVFRVMLQL